MVRAVVGLVAQRPDDDRGVVLVPEHHPGDPVHEGVQIARVVGDLVGVVVGLDVRLVHDVETELVGEVVQRRVARVVGGADRVEPEALEQDQVGAQVAGRHRAPGQRMEVVPVDAPDEHPLAVHQQVPLDDLDVTEADAVTRGVGDAAVGAVQPHGQVVQLGRLGVPGAHVRHVGQQPCLAEEVGHAVVVGVGPVELRVLGQEVAVQLTADVPARGQRAARVPHPAVHPQVSVPPRPDGDVGEVQRIRRVQQHGAGDTAVPPLVLVLDVRGVRPLHDRQPYEGPLAGAHQPRQVELGGQVGVLGDAGRPPVHVHQQHALGGPDLEHDPPSRPVGGHVHRSFVDARRVGGGRVGRVLRERHTDVGVLRKVVRALHGPDAGDVRGGPDVGHRRVRRRQQLEAPVPVQGKRPGAPVDGVHGQPPPGGHLGCLPGTQGEQWIARHPRTAPFARSPMICLAPTANTISSGTRASRAPVITMP